MSIYFISDIHLSEQQPKICDAFLQFLQFAQGQAQSLYILGDLFEVWLGKDVMTPLQRRVITAIEALSNHIPVYFMVGNRDFLVDARLFKPGSVTWLPDPSCIQHAGTRLLLSHGDAWCTADWKYQRFRRLSRHPWCQALFLRLPATLKTGLGNWIRQRSAKHSRHLYRTAPDKVDVSPAAVQAAAQAHQSPQLIHGHTHLPGVHVPTPQLDLTRVVLGDWRENSAFVARLNANAPIELLDVYRLLE